MQIDQLNADYGIAGQLQFVEGKGGTPLLEIANPSAKATISVYGGQVLSFQPAHQHRDLLFLSQKAYYQPGKAIKGGIPVCWPWFGPDPEGLGRSSHGFVRDRLWSVLSTGTPVTGTTQVTLGLTDTPETHKIWPHAYHLSIEITVSQSLTVGLITKNTGDRPFTLSQALHTYFQVGDIQTTDILGLEGMEYIDKVAGGVKKYQEGVVAIASEIDRIYTTNSSELLIDDPTWNRRIRLLSQGSKSTVVWNPWSEISIKMADLEDQDYLKFVCVETANAGSDTIEILPGNQHRLQLTIES